MPDQPWLPFYGDIPATITYPDRTLFELFESSVREHHDQIAVEYLGERIPYHRLETHVLAAAAGLRAIGVRPGHRLALLVANTPHAAVLLYAANRVGAVVSLLHAESRPVEIAAKIGAFEPNWMAVGREHIDGLLRLLADHPVRGIVLCGLDDFGRKGRLRATQRLRRRFDVDQGGIRGIAANPGAAEDDRSEAAPLFSWKSLLSIGSQDDLPPQRELHGPDDLAVVLFSGGTTGTTRGVMHADRQLNAVALQTQVQGPLLAGQSLLSVVPFSHGYGIAVAIHATLSAGATSIIVPHTTPRSLARTIRRTHPEYLIGVPATYSALVLDRVFRRTRHHSLMGAFCGGDRLPRSVRERFAAIVRRRGGAVSIREGYGLTETVTACATMPDNEERHGSVGIPYPDTDIAVAVPVEPPFDPQSEPPGWLPADRVGEILVSGPTIMLGYWRDEAATRSTLHQDDAGRTWLRTGDLGRMDEDGFLYFVERIGCSYTVDGQEVHPGLTELLLSEHSEVLETCVTVQNGDSPPELTAHVTPFDADRDPGWLETHLRESLQTLDSRQQPTRYSFHARLPRTLAGVIDARGLGVERHALQR